MNVKMYRAIAVRDGRWWFVQVPGEQGLYTQVRRLDQAVPMLREVISLMRDVPEGAEGEAGVGPRPILGGRHRALVPGPSPGIVAWGANGGRVDQVAAVGHAELYLADMRRGTGSATNA